VFNRPLKDWSHYLKKEFGSKKKTVSSTARAAEKSTKKAHK
jgi:hypothetical protein